MNTSKKILTVTDLKKSYITKGNTYPVLQGINMEVNQGEFIAVMGPSGSGKTTLLNIISGFLSADSGSVMIGAENMLHTDKNKQAEIRSSILGFIFQDFMLINGLTVRENIYLPQIIGKKIMRKWIKRRKICLIHLESRKLLKNILTNYLADKSKELQLRELCQIHLCLF